MTALRLLLPYLKVHRTLLFVAYGCMVVLGASTAFYAFLAGPALKFVFSGEPSEILRDQQGNLRDIWQFIPDAELAALESVNPLWSLLLIPLLIIATAIVKGLAQAGQFYLSGVVSQRVLLALRRDAFDALMRQSPRFFATRTHGDLLSRLTHDAQAVEQTIFYGCAPLLREPVAIIFLLGFCFFLNFKLAFVTFIILPMVGLPLVRFAKRLKSVSKQGQSFQGTFNTVTHEAMAGVQVVQAFGGEPYEKARLQVASQHYLRQMLKSYFIRAIRTPTMEVLGAVALAALLGGLGYYVRQKSIDPAHFISFFVAIVMMYDPIKKLGAVSDYLATGAAAMERLHEMISAEPDIKDSPKAAPLPAFSHSVRFADVHFSYGHESVLVGIDLELARGQCVALVGPSGAGKSTLANLLPRFYDVTEGCICVDGVDIRSVQLASLRQQMSIVSQDTFLFNASVRQNIAYAKPQATFQDIEHAAIAACAHEFILTLKNGYETVIGERGATLSGGQRQRLAIARALLRNTPLLILDEATSALDVDSEAQVQEALQTLMANRTTLVIAHRLSTIRRADTIAVLQNGRIVERGSHQELLLANGEYARLHAKQFFTALEPERGAVG